jgi:hypothetical protein
VHSKELKTLGWLWFVSALSVVVLTPFLTQLAALAPACTFRQLTGVPCFTCGSTRAVLALKEGLVLEALDYNPLMTLGVVLFILGGILAPWLLPKTAAWKLPRRWTLWVAGFFVLNWAYLILRAVVHKETIF